MFKSTYAEHEDCGPVWRVSSGSNFRLDAGTGIGINDLQGLLYLLVLYADQEGYIAPSPESSGGADASYPEIVFVEG